MQPVVYVRVESIVGNSVEFVAAKTRVSPAGGQTTPRLELLSALLLAKLITSVYTVLKDDMQLGSITCFTDSKVALYWIRGLEKEWKPFVQNRVNEIRKLVPIKCWYHCPGRENPADIPSRGMTPSELSISTLWRHGPNWLICFTMEWNLVEDPEMPEGCLKELKNTQHRGTHTLLSSGESIDLSCIINCSEYSKLNRLLRVTAYVIRAVSVLKSRVKKIERVASPELSAEEIVEAESLWVLAAQTSLTEDKLFDMWKKQFGLFLAGRIWRCKGRLEKAELPYSARHPALLPKNHPVTVLIIKESHEHVMHNGVKETLAETRSKYWIIHGRQVVRQILLKCVICQRYEGLPQPAPQPPPLPQFRVKEEPAFTYVGLDFAGPLHIKTQGLVTERKVWICLYTCCVVRAVHLDIVPDMTVGAFLRCFRRFTSRRGFPRKIVSDNGKTFKSAAKVIYEVLTHPEVKQYSSRVGLQWNFNLEKAPWWGGMFERMVRSTKRCLRKSIGRAKLTYDELLTTLTEVEMILNSRPLSYVSNDDTEEPLTPSHLMMGQRVLNLPDLVYKDDGDEDYNMSQGALHKRMKHFSMILNHFWRRWKKEYLLSLRECHRYSKGVDVKRALCPGDIVVMRDDGSRRGFWRLARVQTAH